MVDFIGLKAHVVSDDGMSPRRTIPSSGWTLCMERTGAMYRHESGRMQQTPPPPHPDACECMHRKHPHSNGVKDGAAKR